MPSLEELADRLQLTVSGDSTRQISGLATLEAAGPGDLAFLSNKKYQAQLSHTRAGAVILRPEFVEACPVDCLVSEDPYLSFARVSRLFNRAPVAEPGVHGAATVSEQADVDASASIGPNAVIEAGAVIGAESIIGANAYIGHGREFNLFLFVSDNTLYVFFSTEFPGTYLIS